MDVVGRADLLGAADDARAASKARGSVFALAGECFLYLLSCQSDASVTERAAVLRDLDGTPPLIVHQAEAFGERHPYEVLFRSSHKLLMDSATSEYLFCQDFWAGDNTIFREIFAPALAAVEESLALYLSSCYDIGCVLLMLRINAGHQAIMSRRRAPCLDSYHEKMSAMLWPRFKTLFEAHMVSIRSAPERTMLQDGLQAHYVTRRFADFAASVHPLAACGGDAQGLSAGMERLRAVVCDLLARISKLLGHRKRQMVFLINNFEVVVTALRDASRSGDPGCEGADRTPLFTYFSDGLARQTHLFVEEELADQFNPLMAFVQAAEAAYKALDAAGQPRAPLPQFRPEDAEPLLRDFRVRWKTSLEEIHRSIGSVFGPGQRSLDILQRTLSQLLLFYTRLTGPEGVLMTYCGAAGAALCRDAVPTSALLAHIKVVIKT